MAYSPVHTSLITLLLADHQRNEGDPDDANDIILFGTVYPKAAVSIAVAAWNINNNMQQPQQQHTVQQCAGEEHVADTKMQVEKERG